LGTEKTEGKVKEINAFSQATPPRELLCACTASDASRRRPRPQHSRLHTTPTTPMSLARLTSVSTSTLSLLLERQRLQSLPQYTSQTSNPLHLAQISKNLAQLRAGVLALEAAQGPSEASALLRAQHARMRAMLGADAERAGIEPFAEQEREEARSPEPLTAPARDSEGVYTPYADDPEAGPEPSIMLQEQRRLMDGTRALRTVSPLSRCAREGLAAPS
jgi:hypothetical protein